MSHLIMLQHTSRKIMRKAADAV